MKKLLFLLLLFSVENTWGQNCNPNSYTVNKSTNNVCANTPITFNIVGLASGFGNIEWDYGHGSPDQNNSTSTTHIFPSSGGTFTVKFKAWAGTPIVLYECGETTVTIKPTPTAGLTTTNLLFCNTSATQTITVNNSSSGASTGSTYSINWGDGTSLAATTTPPNSVTHQFTTQGYKYIVLTVTASNGCSDSDSYTYYNGTNPSISMGNPGGTVGLCAPSPITFPISGFTNNSPGTVYEVYVNNVLDATYQHPPPSSYTYSFAASSCGFSSPNGSNNSYSIKIKASNPCDESLVVVEPVRVSISPTANFTYTPSLCPNNPVTFTNTSLGEDVRSSGCTPAAIQWQLSGVQGVDWTVTSGSIAAPSSNVVTVNFLNTGSYTMCLTASSQICGTNSICKSIVVLPPAEAEAKANTSFFPTPICKDAVFNLSSNGSVGVAPLTYNWTILDNNFNVISTPSTIWSFNTGSTQSSLNPDITIRQAGVYWAKLTLSNTCNSDTALVRLRVIDKPTVVLDAIPDICNTGNPSFISTPTNTHFTDGGAPTTYVWNITGVPNSTQQYPTFSNLTIGTYTITVTATNTCGTASATRSFAVIQQGAVTIALPNNNVICQSLVPIQLTGSPAGGVWSPNAPAGLFRPITPGNNTITYSVTGTCSGSTSTIIVVQNPPTATATSATVCAGETATLTASGGGTYAWNTTPVTTTASLIITTTAATITPSSYSVIVTNAQGCTSTAMSTLTVKPLPVVTMAATSICNTNTNLDLNTAMMVQPPNGVWSPTSAFLTAGGVFNAQAAGMTNSPYSVTYTATVNGCMSSNSAQVTVTSNQPASAGTNKTICKNDTLDLVPLGMPAGGVWSGVGVVNNLFYGLASGVVIGGSGNILTYTVGAGNILCQTSSTMVVTVNDIPTPNLMAANTCVGTTLSLTAAGGGSYSWEGPNGFAQSIANPTITGVTAAAAGDYTVTVTGANTCKNTQSTTIVIYSLPIIALTPMTQCQNITLFDLNTSNPTPSGGVWSGTGVSNGNLFNVNQAVSPPNYPVVYTFTNANGCVNSGNTTVSILTNNSPSAGVDRAICANGGLVNMDSIPFGTPIGGVWSGVGVTNNVFNPNNAGVGVHSLVYTRGAGECAKSDTMLFTVKALPNLTLTSNTPCIKDTLKFSLSVTSPPAGVAYNWVGVNGFTSTLQNPIIPNVQSNAVGIYTVTVTGDNACKDTITNQAIIYGLPNTRSNDTTYCRTAGCYNLPFVSISDPLGTFVWSSFDAAAAVNATAVPPCFTPTISGNGLWHGVVTLTDTRGCIGRDTVEITVTEPRTLALSPTIDTVCSGTNVTLHALPAGGKWYRNSVGFPDPSITNDSIVNTATLIGGGLFHYVYSYGEGSCNVKDSVAIFVIALDTISAGANDAFCINRAPFQLTGQTPLNYTAATAHWENAHVNAAGVYIQNQGITSTGFYTPYAVAGADSSQVIIDTVKFVYTDPVRGCTTTRTKIVTIHPLPVPANAIPDVGCINTLVSFVNNSPNIAQSNWVFYTPQNTVLVTNDSTNVNYVFQDTGVYKVYLEVTSAFGCRASVRDSIHIVAPPHIAFTMSADTICAGLPVTMTNMSSGYEVNYIWDYGDGSPQDNVFAPPPHIFAQAECNKTYYVKLIAYNLCKRDSIVDTIVVRPLPVPKWEVSDNTICSGQLVSFINHTKGCNTKTYNWTIDGAAWTTDSLPPNTRFTANLLPRTYNICLNATGICGDSTICDTIFVLPTTITAFINKDKDRGCRPLTVNFTQSSGGPTAPQFTYYWDFGDGTTSTLANPQHIFDSPTRDTFKVLLLVSDGCFSDTVSTIVYTFPQPRLDFTHPPYQCAEQGMQFTNTSLDPISSAWSFGDNTSSAVTNPLHVFAQAGTYSVRLIGKSVQNGCPDTLTKNVLIRANPIIAPTVNNSDGCGPLLVTFTTDGAPTGFDYYYTWNFGDGGITVDTAHVAVAQSVQHLYTQRDTITQFNVGLTVIDQYQCKSDTLYTPIVLYPTPTADFSYTIDPVCGVNAVASFTNLSTSTAGNLKYVWLFGDNTSSDNANSPTHQYLSSSGRIVTLTAENTYGCADSIQKRLEYCDGLFIPNAFSPETGLGEVRLFGAKGLGIKQYRLAVYSRFGNLIWETDKLQDGLPVERWDGFFNGQIVQQDMYIWKCEAIFENGDIWDGQEDSAGVKQRVGTVTVLR